MSERQYNEEEVALILRAAVEAAPHTADAKARGGITLDALKEIAAEVGIEPARIEAAARAVDRPGPPPVRTMAGMPTTIQLDRLVPVKLREQHLPGLLDLIRSRLARHGIVEEVLGGLEWKARGGLGGRYVSIRPEGEQTRIRVLGNFRDGLTVMGLGLGPIATATTGALAAVLGATGALVIVPVALAGGALTAFGPWRGMFRRAAEPLEQLIDELEHHLLESAREEDV